MATNPLLVLGLVGVAGYAIYELAFAEKKADKPAGASGTDITADACETAVSKLPSTLQDMIDKADLSDPTAVAIVADSLDKAGYPMQAKCFRTFAKDITAAHKPDPGFDCENLINAGSLTGFTPAQQEALKKVLADPKTTKGTLRALSLGIRPINADLANCIDTLVAAAPDTGTAPATSMTDFSESSLLGTV